MEMELIEAMGIVLELAEQNLISEEDNPEEYERQEAAIKAFRIHYEAQ